MKGIYCLKIRVKNGARVRIGSLGELFFEKGSYVYVGSAMSGLENRIARHLRNEKKLHWHIDYLLSDKCARITQVLAKEAGKIEECATAEKIARIGEGIKDFGCGDCKCISHLFKIKGKLTLPGFTVFYRKPRI